MNEASERGEGPRQHPYPIPVIQVSRRRDELDLSTVVLGVLRWLGENSKRPVTRNAIRTKIGCRKDALAAAIAQLVDRGDVIEIEHGKRTTYSVDPERFEARWCDRGTESVVIPWALLRTGLEARQLVLAGYLYKQTPDHFAGVETIAEWLGIPDRCIDTHLAALRRRGLLHERPKGRSMRRWIDRHLAPQRAELARSGARHQEVASESEVARSGAGNWHDPARESGTIQRATPTATPTPTPTHQHPPQPHPREEISPSPSSASSPAETQKQNTGPQSPSSPNHPTTITNFGASTDPTTTTNSERGSNSSPNNNLETEPSTTTTEPPANNNTSERMGDPAAVEHAPRGDVVDVGVVSTTTWVDPIEEGRDEDPHYYDYLSCEVGSSNRDEVGGGGGAECSAWPHRAAIADVMRRLDIRRRFTQCMEAAVNSEMTGEEALQLERWVRAESRRSTRANSDPAALWVHFVLAEGTWRDRLPDPAADGRVIRRGSFERAKSRVRGPQHAGELLEQLLGKLRVKQHRPSTPNRERQKLIGQGVTHQETAHARIRLRSSAVERVNRSAG